jgi:hypothetical protein
MAEAAGRQTPDQSKSRSNSLLRDVGSLVWSTAQSQSISSIARDVPTPDLNVALYATRKLTTQSRQLISRIGSASISSKQRMTSAAWHIGRREVDCSLEQVIHFQDHLDAPRPPESKGTAPFLDDPISSKIGRSDDRRADPSIANICLDHEGGIDSLVAAVEALEKGSNTHARLRLLIHS